MLMPACTRATIWAATAALLMSGVWVVNAAPPAGSSGQYRDWFQSLRDANGQSCCDISDCLRTRARSGPNGYQAQTPAGDWVDVPADKILQRDNPTGEPVMCWLPHRGVMCFVRGVEG